MAGVWTGNLNDDGEAITLVDAADATIQIFTYDDTGAGWHPSTDGGGYSLVILNPSGAAANWNSGASYRPSHEVYGSPGRADYLHGDSNFDNVVGVADLGLLQSRLGSATSNGPSAGDFNRDGVVNRADVSMLASRFGRSFTPPAGNPPPSPEAPAAVLAATSRATLDAAFAGKGEERAGNRDFVLNARAVRRPASSSAVDVALTENVRAGDDLNATLRASRAVRVRPRR